VNLFTLHISVNHANPCKKLKKKGRFVLSRFGAID
jgi:hypothetical protein